MAVELYIRIATLKNTVDILVTVRNEWTFLFEIFTRYSVWAEEKSIQISSFNESINILMAQQVKKFLTFPSVIGDVNYFERNSCSTISLFLDVLGRENQKLFDKKKPHNLEA